MRSIIVVITTFVCCVVTIASVLTIDSYTLQKNEIECAMDFALEQTVRNCLEEGTTDLNSVANKAITIFQSQINSERGDLILYVLHADENIVDMYASFTYTQYNGTKKEVTKRKTVIKDWEDDENDFSIRMISEKYLNEAPERGGLKENSVWKTDTLLSTVLGNQQVDGEWKTVQKVVAVKIEVDSGSSTTP